MIKKISKVTSLLVAAATMISILPASAAEVKKINSDDGVVYNAVAFKDGKAIIDGEVKDNDGAYYYANGKYTELKDVDSGSDFAVYGTKYVNVDEGDYFVDLEKGSVTDDNMDEDDEDDAASQLRKKIKGSDRYLDTISGSTTVFGDTDIADLTKITGNKFSDIWYEAHIAEDKSASSSISKTGLISGTNPYFTVFTDIKGNYIDADYNLGKIKVSTTSAGTTVTTSAAVTIENTKDTYDFRGNDDTYAKIKESITLGQDSSNIYRYAIITVTTVSDKNGQVFINGKAFNIATGSAGATSTVDLKVIQKISKTQNSDDIDDAEYSKTVTNYVISDEDAKFAGTDETNYLNLAKDTTAKDAAGSTHATVIGGKLVLYKVNENSSDDNVTVQAATLKSKNGYYYTDLEEQTTITAEYNDDLDKTAFDTDVDGNIYVIDGGYVKKFDGTDDWDKVYKVDGSMDGLSIYDKNNMVVWSQEDEVYSIIGSKSTDKDTTTDTTKPPVTTTGWIQATNGTWTYVNADGTKATGWLYLGGVWYYLKDDGIMATGWFLSGPTWYYTNASGAMQTGWLYNNGAWYYLNASGAMLSNTTVDGYVLGASGAWIR